MARVQGLNAVFIVALKDDTLSRKRMTPFGQSLRAAMMVRSLRVLMLCPKVANRLSGNGVWKK